MSENPTPSSIPLAGELATIARNASQTIREGRVGKSAVESLDGAAFLFGVAPLLHIVTLAFGGVLFSTGWLIAWTLILPALWVGLRSYRSVTDPIDHATAIAEIDRELGLGDRLIAAREFLAVTDRGPFHEAAIEDAAPSVAIALEGGLERTSLPRVPRVTMARAIGAVLLFFVAFALEPTVSDLADPGVGARANEIPRVAARAPDADHDPHRPAVEPTVPPQTERRRPEPNPSGTEPGGERSGELSEDVKKTLGKTTTGKSSAAASASGTSQSKGSPSNQSQTSDEQNEKSKRKPKKKPKTPKEQKSEPSPAKEPEEMSGATAGRGAASGSSKSPSASKWSSKDQVTSDDEEDLEEDEEVDDEFDNSDARGGVQPQLRDRKAPVNRDLTIGFGNGKNPDANGRGGPSEQKKSRGVASLVLGVPIPDHVKGRPNPGKTKITQERVEPQEEDAPAVVATARSPRKDGIGRVARPDLLPWMQSLVQNYYQRIRAEQSNLETASSKSEDTEEASAQE